MDAGLNEEPGDWRESKLKAGWELLVSTCEEWWSDNTFELAAALAFYTMFSIAPVLLIAVGAASLVLSPQAATDRIVTEVQRMVGAQGAQAVHQVIEASRGFGKSVGAISVGVITFLVGATAVFGELQSALNKIWDVKAKPQRGLLLSLLLNRLRSFSIALVVGFLLLTSLILSAAISALQDYFARSAPGLPMLWSGANIAVSFLAAGLLFAMIYKFLPDVYIGWKDVWIGAAVTATLFTSGKYLIGLYLGHTAAASAFGAAGSFAVLLFWVYYSALISFFGAEFTQVYARRYGSQIRLKEHAVRLHEKADSI